MRGDSVTFDETGLIVKCIFLFLFILLSHSLFAQYEAPFYLKFTEEAERAKTYERIVRNVIYKNLEEPLNDTTEDSYEAAFNAMEVANYSSAATWKKVQEAMKVLPFQSLTFQRSALEVAYAVYPNDFMKEVSALMRTTTDPRIFGMCAVYLLKADPEAYTVIEDVLVKNFPDSLRNHPILMGLQQFSGNAVRDAEKEKVLSVLLSKGFLPGETVLFSFQRKNRDYPGMVMVRKRDGSFVKEQNEYFHAPQLARGIANLPFFLTKGNTPQGLYRMFGFGVSRNQSIGPTANIQMGMPVELSREKFFDNRKMKGDWSIEDYRQLLPESVRDYKPLYETYIAGSAGRNEIIAHGTTIDPSYYIGKPYYPMTPTEGCLCTKEFWDGKLIYSDQQRLINAMLSAGGAYGYVVVIELNDEQRPVVIDDVLQYLN